MQIMIFLSALLLAGFSNEAAAQVFPGGSGEVIYLGQITPPAPPPPPAAPLAPMGELVRLMAINGSYLGVGVRDVDAERKKALNLKE